MGVMLGYSLPLLFLTLFATANLFIPAVHGEKCPESKRSTLLIVFGDSFFDVGRRNDEPCLPSNGPPYGKSLNPKVQTGRFSDGLVVPDYIAKYLDLADNEGKVAPYKSNLNNIQQTLQGHASLSFAMAGARVKQSADKSESLAKQVGFFLDNSNKIFGGSGENFEGMQSETLYLFSVGTYDYLSNLKCIKDEPEVQNEAEHVTAAIVEQVERIANDPSVTGKRFAFTTVALRYLPVVQKVYYKDQSQLDLLDKLETTHYSKLAEKLAKLAEKLRETGTMINYSILQYHSIIKAIMEGPEKYGFDRTTVMAACCGDGSYNADGCGHSDRTGCNDPTAYVFWDGMHNTQHINQEIARIFWNGPKDMTFPQNLQTLAGTQKPQYEFSVNADELIGIQSVTCTRLLDTTEKQETSIRSN